MGKNLFQVFFILIIFLFSTKSGGGGAKKWWGRGPTSPSPSAVPVENYHICVGQNKRLPWERKNKGINYYLKPFLSCSSESIALQLGAFVLHKPLKKSAYQLVSQWKQNNYWCTRPSSRFRDSMKIKAGLLSGWNILCVFWGIYSTDCWKSVSDVLFIALKSNYTVDCILFKHFKKTK